MYTHMYTYSRRARDAPFASQPPGSREVRGRSPSAFVGARAPATGHGFFNGG